MTRVAVFALACAGALSAAVAPIQIWEVDGVTQTNRVHILGMAFKQGDIANCAVPVIGGSALNTSSYQCDAKTRWPDGSLKTASLVFIASLTSGQQLSVSFQSGVCNNAGYLDQAGMIAFNGGAWDSQILVTANAQTVTTSAKAMITALSVARCQIEYEMQGPIATQVRVQDCTATMSFDFGWHWSGGVMTDNSGTPYVTTSQFASLHPFCDLTFVPSTSAVWAQCGLKNQWNGKRQDQVYSVEIKVGSPLVSVYTKASFTHFEASNWRKSFWSGAAPGHTRVDWNFPYLISTKMLANYDLTSNVTTAIATTTTAVNTSKAYTDFITSPHDMGDIMGYSRMVRDMASNDEGALEQMSNLRYLYQMNSCGTVNGPCAKAWDMLTGEVDANSSNTLVGVNGGGGDWAVVGSIPMHADESRTGLKFFCPSYDTPNATQATTCDGTEEAQGRPISRDADRNVNKFSIANVGTATLNTWNTETACEHWLDYSFVPAILLASRYQREELYAAAANCTSSQSAAQYIFGGANGFFANAGAGEVSVRRFAWGIYTTAKAALVAPDGTIEKTYYAAKVRSNLMMEEGEMGITGTSLSPTTTLPTCSGYVANPNNRWNYLHCTIGRGLFPALNGLSNGQCYSNGDETVEMDPATMSKFGETYFDWFGIVAFQDMIRKGFPDVSTILGRFGKRIVERILDPGSNRWLVGSEIFGVNKSAAGTCTSSTDDGQFTTWAQVMLSYLAPFQTKSDFLGSINFPCDDHGYSLIARAATAAAIDAGITSGSYTAVDAWTWINAQQPMFATGGLPLGYCASWGDQQLKFALLPSVVVTPPATVQFSGAVKLSGGVH